jgi:hypothetical protein
MKKILFFALLFVAFSSCKEQFCISDAPDCVQEKIEAHKKLPYATTILTIVSKGERVYWFQDEYIDGGEDIINDKCEVVCIVDCECLIDISKNCPSADIKDWEIVWKK